MDLSFYDSAKVYPNLVGTEHEYCLYKRWQLNMVNVSHAMLDDLISYLEGIEMEYNGSKIVVYSES